MTDQDQHGNGQREGLPRQFAFDTRAVHAGQRPEPLAGAIMTPVYLTSTYVQEGLGVFAECAVGGLTRARLRVLAARGVAVDAMLRGASIVETFRLLNKSGVNPTIALTYVQYGQWRRSSTATADEEQARDGEQSPGATMTSAEKLALARSLARMGVEFSQLSAGLVHALS